MERLGDDLLERPELWGMALVQTEDHDPLYPALARLGSDAATQSRVRRFMLAYWCCYSVGASWWLSQHTGPKFWHWLRCAAQNQIGPEKLGAGPGDRWPRAPERRHWRGQKCVDSVLWLSWEYPEPENAVESLSGCRTLSEVRARVTSWPQFGPWIAFKAADMLERVLGWPVEFPNDVLSFYDDPRVAATMVGDLWSLSPGGAAARLRVELSRVDAPGLTPRACNVQEVETVLCKWKSARGGHYFIGRDIRDHRRELEAWRAFELLSAYATTPLALPAPPRRG